ncbi:MAG TPA: glycoside hydrolase family protein [Polyangiaceae bacterium]|jgi:hypothetical protein|nr:glycoside hydrolase family protein [Polyangiaceae bacterium]
MVSAARRDLGLAVRCAGVGATLGLVLGAGAVLAACGTNELEPIRPGPTVDAGGSSMGTRDAAAVTQSCKRGVAMNDGPGAAFAASASAPGVAWFYDWAAQSPGDENPRVEFVPMIWGGGSLTQAVPAGARYLLGFNEPDFKSQSNLTAQQAASDWPAVQAKARAAGVPLVSPSVNFCGATQCSDPTATDPYTYLEEFFADCAGCEVDYIGVHAYQCDVPSLEGYLDGNTDAGGTLEGFAQFGKPLWITELACDSTHSVADQKAYMQAAVPYLEGNARVFRYAWFNADPIPNAELTNGDGSLTDLGTTYVGLAATCP